MYHMAHVEGATFLTNHSLTHPWFSDRLFPDGPGIRKKFPRQLWQTLWPGSYPWPSWPPLARKRPPDGAALLLFSAWDRRSCLRLSPTDGPKRERRAGSDAVRCEQQRTIIWTCYMLKTSPAGLLNSIRCSGSLSASWRALWMNAHTSPIFQVQLCLFC